MEKDKKTAGQTKVIIVRHGNTFDKGDIVTRVGRRTDLALSESGKMQAIRLGSYLAKSYPKLDMVYTGTLKRTIETASLVLDQFRRQPKTTTSPDFDEIDYGPDENKPECEVVERIGKAALNAWNEDAIPPQGWQVDPGRIIEMWKNFFLSLANSCPGTVTMVVTSNGIARFAPFCLADPDGFRKKHTLKLSTCAFGEFQLEGNKWFCHTWNRRGVEL